MKIALVHNRYGVRSGEEVMIDRIAHLLKSRGHEVLGFFRDSAHIAHSPLAHTRAFFSGVYSPAARRDFRRFLQRRRPDLIQIQNLYPLLSPSVLLEAHDQGIPIVMRCANFRLICPTGLCYTGGRPCQRCVSGREWWCMIKNCQQSWPRSLGYALRNYVARTHRWFKDTVNVYLAQTTFQKRLLVQAGYHADRIHVVPNMIGPSQPSPGLGSYVAYIGRISHEKGIHTLLAAAKHVHPIPVRIAGPCAKPDAWFTKAPSNVHYDGVLSGHELETFYADARMVVVPSTCYEGMPSALLEAMAHAKPVICSDIGGLGEVVINGHTGLLFSPADPVELANKTRHLWRQDGLVRSMGLAGWDRARRLYSEDQYFSHLIAAYAQALRHTETTPSAATLPTTTTARVSKKAPQAVCARIPG